MPVLSGAVALKVDAGKEQWTCRPRTFQRQLPPLARGDCANAHSSFLWPSKDAPRYFTGFGTTLAEVFCLAAVAFTARTLFKRYPYPTPPSA